MPNDGHFNKRWLEWLTCSIWRCSAVGKALTSHIVELGSVSAILRPEVCKVYKGRWAVAYVWGLGFKTHCEKCRYTIFKLNKNFKQPFA